MPVKFSGGNELIDAMHLLGKGGVRLGMKVADLGCGSSGHFVFPAAHLVGPDGQVFAADILKSVLNTIQSRAKFEGVANVVPVWADLERKGGMGIAPVSVDVALLCSTLFQVKDRETVIDEAKRILKPGGMLIVAEWKIAGALFGPPAALRLDAGRLAALIGSRGFEKKEEFEAGPYHYGLVFRKL